MRSITIGRSSRCDIVVANEHISRVHAEISLVGNQYVYKDVSKNGTNVGGRIICNEKIVIAPGATVLMANRVPLPWAQIYALLPLQGARPYEDDTIVYPHQDDVRPVPSPYPKDELGVGWGILAFLIPIAGWIMYFCWKDQTPHRASQAAVLAWISFGIGFLMNIIAFF